MSMLGRDPEEQRRAKDRRDACVNEAIVKGAVAAVEAGCVSGSCVYAMQRYSHVFRTKFPVSAKTSFVVIPVFYMFYLKSEHAVVSCSQRHKKTFEDMMRHQHSSS